ncbi:hypothetical protein HPP92_004918 [Vanilla planifolia]|uniref:Uncharacterized protein n=1 Tax=Vanilla planifolia TaxID=51239 RepID=A0A835RLT7_VANPL|nr:hypothetical protein HPP92_004918 [Vanilla planifolia]
MTQYLPRCGGGVRRRGSNVAGRRRRGRTSVDLKAGSVGGAVPYGGVSPAEDREA